MEIYPEMAAAMRADDVDRYAALLHENFQYVRHKSNDSLNRDQMAALLRKVWRDPSQPSAYKRKFFGGRYGGYG